MNLFRAVVSRARARAGVVAARRIDTGTLYAASFGFFCLFGCQQKDNSNSLGVEIYSFHHRRAAAFEKLLFFVKESSELRGTGVVIFIIASRYKEVLVFSDIYKM